MCKKKGKEQCATRRQTANSLNPVTKRSPAAPHCRATLSHTVRQSRIGAKRNAEKKNRNVNGNGWGRGVATPPTGRGRRRRRLEPKGQPPAAPATAGPPAGGDNNTGRSRGSEGGSGAALMGSTPQSHREAAPMGSLTQTHRESTPMGECPTEPQQVNTATEGLAGRQASQGGPSRRRATRPSLRRQGTVLIWFGLFCVGGGGGEWSRQHLPQLSDPTHGCATVTLWTTASETDSHGASQRDLYSLPEAGTYYTRYRDLRCQTLGAYGTSRWGLWTEPDTLTQ